MLDVKIKSKSYASSSGTQLDVLRDLEFVCADQSFTCIVGSSGCGKTTALKCILGLDNQFDGSVNVRKNSGSHKISAVFQEPRLLPWRTVEQNVRLALATVDESALGDLFEELGLSEHRDLYPTELSLGLARRASLARAFAVGPSVLILDEPFVSLDENTAARLRRLLLKVWGERACTVLMVTHNLTEAIELADRILFFKGTPASVQDTYTISTPRSERDKETVISIRNDIETSRPQGDISNCK